MLLRIRKVTIRCGNLCLSGGVALTKHLETQKACSIWITAHRCSLEVGRWQRELRRRRRGELSTRCSLIVQPFKGRWPAWAADVKWMSWERGDGQVGFLHRTLQQPGGRIWDKIGQEEQILGRRGWNRRLWRAQGQSRVQAVRAICISICSPVTFPRLDAGFAMWPFLSDWFQTFWSKDGFNIWNAGAGVSNLLRCCFCSCSSSFCFVCFDFCHLFNLPSLLSFYSCWSDIDFSFGTGRFFGAWPHFCAWLPLLWVSSCCFSAYWRGAFSSSTWCQCCCCLSKLH